nr:hypothetical protein [Steroidobacter gossypii]
MTNAAKRCSLSLIASSALMRAVMSVKVTATLSANWNCIEKGRMHQAYQSPSALQTSLARVTPVRITFRDIVDEMEISEVWR